MKRRREMKMKRNGEEKRNGDEEKWRKNEPNEGRRGLYSNISVGITDGTLIVVGGIKFHR